MAAVIDGVKVANASQFVAVVENVLGWVPPEGVPWKVRSIEAAKINRKVKTRPNLYTWENLVLAVEFMRREKIAAKSPVGVCWFVERALKQAHVERPSSDMTTAVEEAIARERAERALGWEAWVERLARARGPARTEVLDEWQRERG